MNRTFVGAITSLLTFSLLFGVSPARSQQPSAASSAITEASRAEAVRFLTDLVKIDTSNPPGNETAAAKAIQAVLEHHKLALAIEQATGTPSTASEAVVAAWEAAAADLPADADHTAIARWVAER